MKKIIGIGLVTALAAIAAPASAATIARCTVVNSGPLTSVLGGNGYSIANAIGSASGAITCPALAASAGTFYNNYKVFAITDFQNADFLSLSNTVTQVLTLVGGALSGATQTAISTGYISSSSNSPANPFQIGSTLAGPATSYGSFTVDVTSSVTAGGPIGNSGGQVYISYDVVPEPATWALMLAGFGLTGAAMRQKKMALSYS